MDYLLPGTTAACISEWSHSFLLLFVDVRVGLDSVTGEGMQIEFSDYLNGMSPLWYFHFNAHIVVCILTVPHMRAEAPPVTLHDVMEVKLNLV